MDLVFIGYKSKTLRAADKLIRYKNHITFIKTYLKAKKIPNGFKMKFHNNLDLDVSHILSKCSVKLMKRPGSTNHRGTKEALKMESSTIQYSRS